MKRGRWIVAALCLSLGGLAGCQTAPQITPDQVAQFTNAVAQAQAAYEQIQPVVQALQPVVEQLADQYLHKDDEEIGAPVARGEGRDPKWPPIRDAYARVHPFCAICGKPVENVHHVVPVHLAPSLELEPSNLVSFCRTHHFTFGHLGDWHSWNTNLVEDTRVWRAKYQSRPR